MTLLVKCDNKQILIYAPVPRCLNSSCINAVLVSWLLWLTTLCGKNVREI